MAKRCIEKEGVKKKKLKEMRLFVVYKGEGGGVVLLEGRQRSLNEHGGGVRGAG
jgi:hypothetical protein